MLIPQRGQVVRSLAGKDGGRFLVVVATLGQAVLLADGKGRPLERPKRKNVRHVAPTDFRLTESEMATNRGLRRALKAREPNSDREVVSCPNRI